MLKTGIYEQVINNEISTQLEEHIDFIDETVDLSFECPLDFHCTYTLDQILAAMDYMKPYTVREGVKYLPEKNIDIFFITLHKSVKDYSPTIMNNYYSINENLFHRKSQSTTSDTSPRGQRYIHHRELREKILLLSESLRKIFPVQHLIIF